MPLSKILTNDANIKIKEVIKGKELILECEDEGEDYCPYCGSFDLRCKDSYTRHIKNISIGLNATILRIKTHKYVCKDCGRYFCSRPRGLLRKKRETLEPWQQSKIDAYLNKQPVLRQLYNITQELMNLFNEKHCKFKDCKKRLIPKLLKFIELLKECGFEMFKKLGKTIENWSEEIARMFRFTKSNGITEGFHRKMKLIQRRAYGFRNFENYRLRVRILCA